MITNISPLFDSLLIIIIIIALLLAIIAFGLGLIRMCPDLFNSDKTKQQRRDKNMNYNDQKRIRTLIDQYKDARVYYDNRIKVLTEELGEE